jgi:hypothetical protein
MTKEAEAILIDNRIRAFDFGLDVALNELGITKEAMANAVGVEDPDKLSQAILYWLGSREDGKQS